MIHSNQPLLFRQGDILIRSVESVPPKAKLEKPQAQIVLAEGEATGHFHAIEQTEGVRHYKDGRFRQWIVVDTPVTTLRHPEHAPIEIPSGTYEVVRQREYQPYPFGDTNSLGEAAQYVSD